MAFKSNSEIREAVRVCLDRCAQGGTPLGVIAEFIAELQAAGWLQADIRKVESTVLKLMSGIVTPDESNTSGPEESPR